MHHNTACASRILSTLFLGVIGDSVPDYYFSSVLTRLETELTTAATDAALGLQCLWLAVSLVGVSLPMPWKRNVWVAMLLCMVVGSGLGAVAHGLTMSDATRNALWKPLYLSLGVAVALLVVAAVCDWSGEDAARRLLPWALAAALVFFAASQWLGGAFWIFVVYEAAATLTALAIYATLAFRGNWPGASLLAVGLVLTLVAAAVQVSSVNVRVLVRFDHNGLFHVVQMIAIALMAAGVRASL